MAKKSYTMDLVRLLNDTWVIKKKIYLMILQNIYSKLQENLKDLYIIYNVYRGQFNESKY